MEPFCNFEMNKPPDFELQKPTTMHVIKRFHALVTIDSFEKSENAIFPTAATIIRRRGGGESLYNQSIFCLITSAEIASFLGCETACRWEQP